MGRNRRHSQPERYPAAFLTAIRDGYGLFEAHDFPWTVGSIAKRFRLCLAVIKEQRHHPLYPMAARRWSLRPGPDMIEVLVSGAEPRVNPNALLVAQALAEAELTGDDK